MNLHQHSFVKSLESAIKERCGVKTGDRLLLATSGGADSVALALGLHALSTRKHWELDLHLAHVNHHLRAEADEEAAFVEQLAAKLELPIYTHEIFPAQVCGNLEANAREGRYGWMCAQAHEIQADALLTAHHADDQLETLLMRMLRGASVNGMSGIRFTSERFGMKLMRPMLVVTHQQAVDFLKEADQSWCEDPSNADTALTRNQLRHAVLPVLRELYPQSANKVQDLADQMNAMASFLDQQANKWLSENLDTATKPIALKREALQALPIALTGQIVRKLATHLGSDEDKLGQNQLGPIISAIYDNNGESRSFALYRLGLTLSKTELSFQPV